MNKKIPVTPHCPYCKIKGLDKLAAKIVGDIRIIFCGVCGAIRKKT